MSKSTSLQLPKAERLEALASHFTIPLKDQGETGPFIFSPLQRKLAEYLEEYPWIVLLKPRQIFATTVFCFWLYCLALMNPGLAFGLVLQDQKKANEKLEVIRKFALQTGVILTTDNASKIVFENGSEIHALSARGGEAEGEESPIGRSATFAAALLSEAGYYPNDKAYKAIKAVVGDGPLVIESTASGPDGFFYSLCTGDSDFRSVFFSVEDDPRRRLPADTIDDATWEHLKSEFRFSIREAAAWWWRELKNSGGDVISHLRDFPVRPEDPFRVSESRWVQADPKVVAPHEERDGVVILKPPVRDRRTDRYVGGVDTAWGVGAAASAAVVLHRHTREVVAYCYSNEIKTDELARRTKVLYDLYDLDALCVEENGVGQSTIYELQRLGVPAISIKTTESSRYSGLLLAKSHVEAGKVFGPEPLLEECRRLRVKRNRTNVEFVGPKDLLMAVGFALRWIEDNPWEPERIQSQDVYYADNSYYYNEGVFTGDW